MHDVKRDAHTNVSGYVGVTRREPNAWRRGRLPLNHDAWPLRAPLRFVCECELVGARLRLRSSCVHGFSARANGLLCEVGIPPYDNQIVEQEDAGPERRPRVPQAIKREIAWP